MAGMSALNTAISGLNAAQRAIETTSQNIVNANTPGYARQRVQMSSLGATTASHFYTGDTGTFIGGVQVDGVFRVRDTFLETARVNAGGAKAALDVQASTLSGAEGLLNEPGENGVQAVLDDFYSSWHDLAANPGDAQKTAAAGAVVLQKASAVTTQLKFVSAGLDERWAAASDQLSVSVGQLNQAATDLAVVNQKIKESVVADRPANELMDKRDTLVRTIGELAGGRAVEGRDGEVNVLVNGITLVSGNRAEQFTVAGGINIVQAGIDPPRVMLGAIQVPIQSGRTAGLLASLGTDLPTMDDQLNSVAVALRDAVNTVHNNGYTLDGTAGTDFFSGSGAGDLEVIPQSGADLAVASAAGVVDGANAMAIGDLALDDNSAAVLGGTPGASVQLRGLAADVGTKLQGLNNAADVQSTVLDTANAAADSDSGVSIDEEMTSLLMYQRAYQASARVITAVDEMMDTLVNHTGTVGR
jgi:flagellar hook-associated protein 1 FlgK